MVASLIFKANKNHDAEGKPARKVEFERARNFYRKLLHKSLKRRGLVLAGVLGLFVLSFFIVPFLGTEFMPAQDQDMLILKVKMPVGTSIDETNRVAQMVVGPVSRVRWDEVAELPETSRGPGGFGHTGRTGGKS